MSKKSNAATVEAVVVAAKVKKTFPAMSEAEQATLDGLPTTASKIRYCHSLGWSQGDISRKLNIIFQHVNNTLKRPLKKAAE